MDAPDGKQGTKQTKASNRIMRCLSVKKAFLLISDLKITDRFLRKQNLKFPVTITEVVLLRGLPLLSKKKITPKIFRSYLIKGRMPLIETQKNVRNKRTLPSARSRNTGLNSDELVARDLFQA